MLVDRDEGLLDQRHRRAPRARRRLHLDAPHRVLERRDVDLARLALDGHVHGARVLHERVAPNGELRLAPVVECDFRVVLEVDVHEARAAAAATRRGVGVVGVEVTVESGRVRQSGTVDPSVAWTYLHVWK